VSGLLDSGALKGDIGGIGTATPGPQACFSTKEFTILRTISLAVMQKHNHPLRPATFSAHFTLNDSLTKPGLSRWA
jgi:hypothetical protein